VSIISTSRTRRPAKHRQVRCRRARVAEAVAARGGVPEVADGPAVVRARHLFKLKYVMESISTRSDTVTRSTARRWTRHAARCAAASRTSSTRAGSPDDGETLEDVASASTASTSTPLGVFAAITPFNSRRWCRAGRPYAIRPETLHLKPSEQVPFSSTGFSELTQEAGIRPGS